MSPILLFRLWLMVFLQYFIWGTWYVTMGTYLGTTLHFSGGQLGLAYGTPAIGAMISPFFVGMVADRFFATEKIMAVLHLLGALLLYLVSQVTAFSSFYPLLILYTLCYMATLALTNSLTLHQLANPDRHFPLVMLMGSVGWIAAGLVIGQLKVESSPIQFQLAALASAVMSVYCLTLPHTPPKQAGTPATIGAVLGLDALKLMKEPSFAVFVLGSFLICIPLSFYFAWTNLFLNELGVANAASKMTLGQVSDVTFLLLLPFFLARLGVKKIFLVGMLAWTVRFGLFTLFSKSPSTSALMYAGILLHGMCYDFLFVMGRIYVDRRAPAEIRGTAQGLIAFVTLGAGMFVGTWFSGIVGEHYAIPGSAGVVIHRWPPIWIIPSVMAALVLVLFAVIFRDDRIERKGEAEPLALLETGLPAA